MRRRKNEKDRVRYTGLWILALHCNKTSVKAKIKKAESVRAVLLHKLF